MENPTPLVAPGVKLSKGFIHSTNPQEGDVWRSRLTARKAFVLGTVTRGKEILVVLEHVTGRRSVKSGWTLDKDYQFLSTDPRRA